MLYLSNFSSVGSEPVACSVVANCAVPDSGVLEIVTYMMNQWWISDFISHKPHYNPLTQTTHCSDMHSGPVCLSCKLTNPVLPGCFCSLHTIRGPKQPVWAHWLFSYELWTSN